MTLDTRYDLRVKAETAGRAVVKGATLVRSFYARDGSSQDYFGNVIALFRSICRPLFANELRRLFADPERAAVFERGEDLMSALDDLPALAALPEGSFGRAYYDFRQHFPLNAAGLVEFSGLAEEARNHGWTDAERWIGERTIIEHDLWHAITGYPADLSGEQYINAFGATHLRTPGSLVMAVLPVTHPRLPVSRRRWLLELRRAYERGSATPSLLGRDYLRMLDWPLEKVRAKVGIPPMELFHPDGLLRFDFDAFWPANQASSKGSTTEAGKALAA